jgi:hypothetical protein
MRSENSLQRGDVQWNGFKLELNEFSGNAVKLFGKRFSANVFTWLTLAGLTWYSFGDAGIVDESPLPAREQISQILDTVTAFRTPEPCLFPGTRSFYDFPVADAG